MTTPTDNGCLCGVCAMLGECRPKSQIADREMLTNLFEFCDNLFNDDPTRQLPALSPLHETYRSKVWGPTVWKGGRW